MGKPDMARQAERRPDDRGADLGADFILGKVRENDMGKKGIVPRWSRIYKGYPFALSFST